MVIITIHSGDEKTSVEFTDQEWRIIKKHLFEDSLEFHAIMCNELNEFTTDMSYIHDSVHVINFNDYPELVMKLKLLGINTFDNTNGKNI